MTISWSFSYNSFVKVHGAKPECDNVLQKEPRTEGCNTLSHSGLANANTEKNVISSLLYAFLSSTPSLNGNEAAVY